VTNLLHLLNLHSRYGTSSGVEFYFIIWRSCVLYSPGLWQCSLVETVCFFGKLVTTYQSTWHHKP